MFSALVYLQYHTIKNRTVSRLKRLKQPKYLVGAIAGGLYFYFYFFRYLFGSGGRGGGLGFVSSPEDLAFLHLVSGLVLFMIMLGAWVLPNSRATLAFTEAEIAFLFPAPISRRGLIHYKLLRSQVGIFFTVLLLTLLTNRLGGKAWIHAAGWWLILSTINLHMLGASFARTMLLDRGISNWQRKLWVSGAVLVVVGAAVLWTRRSMAGMGTADFSDLASIREYVETVLTSGPIYLFLLPFRALTAPYLSGGGGAFLIALPGALLVLVLHYWWVVRFNVAFEEASLEASQRMAERIAAVRAGNWSATQSKPVRAPFRLRPMGLQATAVLWKNLIGAGRGFSARLWFVVFAACIGGAIGLVGSSDFKGLPVAMGGIAGMFLIWSLLLGPQVLRQDFRQDLPMADLLKAYPVPGWQMALGELLAPAIILTVIQWFLLVLTGLLLFGDKTVGLGWPGNWSVGAGAAVILPLLNLISLCIPNAAVLLFPAWFQAGKEAAHGIEATGQRLIAMLAQVLVFVLSLVPAAIAFGIVLIVTRSFLGLTLAIPLASVAAALVLAVEGGFWMVLLGRLFERFNVTE